MTEPKLVLHRHRASACWSSFVLWGGLAALGALGVGAGASVGAGCAEFSGEPAGGGLGSVGGGPNGGAGAGASGGRSSSLGGGGVASQSGGKIGSGTPGSGGSTQGAITKLELNGKKALLVVDNPASLDDGDLMLQEMMTAKGMVVKLGSTTVADATAATADLIIGSSGAAGAEFATLYKDLSVPILTFGNGYYLPLDFIAASSSRGNAPSTSTLTVIDAGSHLAASFTSGAVLNVISPLRNTQIYWATPGGVPIKVASVMGNASQMCAFAYEKGAMMSRSPAPGRRVSLCWKTDALKDLAIDSFRLMNAAIEWTAGGL